MFLERSSLLGRGRVFCITGDAGSFLTMILGGTPPFRELMKRGPGQQEVQSRASERVEAYALRGEVLVGGAADLGLPLLDR